MAEFMLCAVVSMLRVLTFQSQGLVKCPAVRLGVMCGGGLWGSGGLQVRVGVRLNGGGSFRRVRGEEGTTGLSPGNLDSARLPWVPSKQQWRRRDLTYDWLSGVIV